MRVLLALAALLLAVVLAALVREDRAVRRDATRFLPPGRLVDVGGRRLHLHCVGEGTPTVILEAGGTSGILEYLDLQDAVAGVTRVCAYDRAGMGWSDDAPHALDAASLATDLEALLAAADVPGPYVVVAGSAGGLTAELFTRRHPDAVVGLLLLDALHSELLAAPSMDAGARALHRKATLAGLLAQVGLLAWLDPYDLDRHPEPRRSEARALKYHPRPWRAVRALVGSGAASRAALAAAPPLRDDLPLVVVTHDPAVDAGITLPEAEWGAAQAALARQSQAGRLHVLPGSGHHPEIDRPEAVLTLLLELVAAARHPGDD